MKNRKSVMFISALLILIFHLWVNVTNAEAERFIRAISYIGVDMFFFLSAYSLGKRDVCDYKEFILKRFNSVYLKFVIFAVIAFVYSGWKINKLLSVVTGYELFVRGGGAFLWFLPSIMLFYILVPFLQKADNKNRKLTITLSLLIWFVVGILVTSLTKYKAMFIFFNRIPILLLGFYASRIMNEKQIILTDSKRIVYGIVSLAVGIVCLYLFGYKNRLITPIYDLFYVTAIPASVGLILLSELIPEKKLISVLGSATLEIYAVQMIFGFNIANIVIKTITRSSALHILLINILVFTSVSLIALGFNKIFNLRLKKN